LGYGGSTSVTLNYNNNHSLTIFGGFYANAPGTFSTYTGTPYYQILLSV